MKLGEGKHSLFFFFLKSIKMAVEIASRGINKVYYEMNLNNIKEVFTMKKLIFVLVLVVILVMSLTGLARAEMRVVGYSAEKICGMLKLVIGALELSMMRWIG